MEDQLSSVQRQCNDVNDEDAIKTCPLVTDPDLYGSAAKSENTPESYIRQNQSLSSRGDDVVPWKC